MGRIYWLGLNGRGLWWFRSKFPGRIGRLKGLFGVGRAGVGGVGVGVGGAGAGGEGAMADLEQRSDVDAAGGEW